MSEQPIEQPIEALPEAPTTRQAVYDNAELRYVDSVKGESASATAKRLNAENKDGKGAKRADGKSGPRYTVEDV